LGRRRHASDHERIENSRRAPEALVADPLVIDDPKNGGVARLGKTEAASQRKDTPSRLGRRDPTARERPESRCQARVGGIGHANRVAAGLGRECVEIAPNQRTRMSCSLEHKAALGCILG
jgi:hypothetical protein